MIERHKENMVMVMISILSSPVNTQHICLPGLVLLGLDTLNKILYLIPTQIQTEKSFFFPLSFFRKDEDYVIVYLKKILYLSFSQKYILKIIHFFLFFTFFKDLIMCLVQIKKSINLQFFLLCQKIKPKFFFPTCNCEAIRYHTLGITK